MKTTPLEHIFFLRRKRREAKEIPSLDLLYISLNLNLATIVKAPSFKPTTFCARVIWFWWVGIVTSLSKDSIFC